MIPRIAIRDGISSLRTFAAPLLLLVLILGTAGSAQAQTKLLRFPDIHGERVVFTYAGDIWTAPATGGTAVRITADEGLELFPRFSPDGRWIAFTGQYDGDEQVYIVPSDGGMPRQLTFYPARGPLAERWGYDNQVYGWTPDGGSVLFRSMRSGYDLSDTQLFTVSLDGGLPEALPMPESGTGALSPDGSRVVYSPVFRDFRSWKRYEGGWAQELYVFDLSDYGLQRVTDHPRADRDPMWIGDRIYFNSDRDDHFNLYAWNETDGSIEQITDFDPWDVRWPSDDGEGRIVFELNGELQVYDIAQGEARPISIRVPDDGLWMRPSRVSAANLIENYSLGPEGNRALFVARGDIFTVPKEHGPTRNLTRSSGAHDKWARWSPDGSRIAFISDADGEDEVWLVAPDGSSAPEQLTDGGTALRYAPEWSPDGTRIAFSDKDGKLYVLDVASRALTEVADEVQGQLRDYTWAPGSGHLAFTLSEPNSFRSIWIWSAADGQLHRVTSDRFNEFSPAWDPDGQYLFYMSDRQFTPQTGSIEWNYVTDRESYLYALALRRDVPSPFPPRSDEVAADSGDDGGDGDENGDSVDPATPITIHYDGLAERVARVPIDADNYGGLSAIPGHLLYFRGGAPYYGRGSDVQTELRIFSLEDREEKTFASNAGGYALSPDGEKVLVASRGSFTLYDAKPSPGEGTSVSTADLEVNRVPAEEWEQIFHEVWRRFRDFFYVENMHGYDWVALREQYEPWLEHVAHRSDLNYLISEMVAELSVGHAYKAGGDWATPPRPRVALPGAVFEADGEAGRYRIIKIFRGHNEEPRYRAPLAAIGLDAREGDLVLAIDGEPLTLEHNPYERLRHRADQAVTLTLAAGPGAEPREVRYQPVTSEDALIYLDRMEANRRKVEEATNGRVGYLHVPDMGASGIYEFIKNFYGQIRKEGLIIDVRGNGGGNVSQMLIERLGRTLLGTRFSRNSERAGTYPAWVFHGHMVCLLDEDSASDGDIFPHMFRQAGLGPLIGKRSWGGVVGITSHGPLIDGGGVNVPEFGTNDLDGNWIIEGYGVAPDIEVENDPASVIAGRDPQLERGIAEVMRAIEADPKRLPERQPLPVKTPDGGAR
jgi:tricorn protease